MASPVNDPIERRLRAARPEAANVAADAADHPEATAIRAGARTRPPSVLGAGVVTTPRPRRRLVLRTGVVAALVTALAVVLGWPGSQSGPQEAVARPIALAIHWFDPPAGTILHVRSTRTGDAGGYGETGVPARGPDETTREESWQSVDDPAKARTISELNGRRAEFGPDGLYDASRDTVYLNVAPSPGDLAKLGATVAGKKDMEKKASAAKAAADAADQRQAEAAGAGKPGGANEGRPATGTDKPGAADQSQPAADPTIAKIRWILEHRDARVVGQHGDHGDETYSIELPGDPAASDTHATRWTLRIAADGRPLELRIDGGDGTAPLETTTWETYEVMPAGSGPDGLTTVRGAHPDATVVRDLAAFDSAAARMFPPKLGVNVAPPANAKPTP